MTPTAPDASTEAATSELSGQAGEKALKASAENLSPKGADFSVSSEADESAPAKAKKAATNKTAPEPKTPAPAAKHAAVSPSGVDEVLTSRLAPNQSFRKSLSVVHLQRRLTELGYPEANSDIGGHIGALTVSAISAWQTSRADPVGPLTPEQILEIFKGDHNVRVIIDTPS